MRAGPAPLWEEAGVSSDLAFGRCVAIALEDEEESELRL